MAYITGAAGGSVATDTLFDAKGDLAVGTGADTAGRLAVGANDTILMADSGETTGLKWASPATTAEIADVTSGAESAGTSDTWARGDHVHHTAAGGSVATDAIFDAKGDLAVGTGADTASKVSLGATGQVLFVDSSISTGVKWANFPTITNQSTTYGAQPNDFVRCSGTFTVTLPSPLADSRCVFIKNAGTGVITVARGGSDTIFTATSGQTSFTLGPGEAVSLIYYSSGSEWLVW